MTANLALNMINLAYNLMDKYGYDIIELIPKESEKHNGITDTCRLFIIIKGKETNECGYTIDHSIHTYDYKDNIYILYDRDESEVEINKNKFFYMMEGIIAISSTIETFRSNLDLLKGKYS